MKLASKLSDWQKNQLITADQRLKILEYENNVRRPMLLYSLLFLSAFYLGIGFISVIASNWEAIPAVVKQLVDILLLILTAWGISTARNQNKNLLSEGLIILYALLIMASIGLTGQIYHLPAKGLSAVLFWSVLSFPLLFLCVKPFFPGIWIGGFFGALYDYLYGHVWFYQLVNKLFADNHNYGMWLLLWSMTVLGRLLNKTRRLAWQQAWHWWTVTAFIFCTMIMDMFSVSLLSLNSQTLEWYYWGGAVFLLGSLWLSDTAKSYWTANASLTVILAYAVLSAAAPALEDVASAVMIIALLGIVSKYAYDTRQNRLFNFTSILIALRLFGIYLEVFGSLLSTGTGLILSGLIFMGLAVFWQKMRFRLFPKIEEESNV